MVTSKKLWSYDLERNFLMDGIIEWKIKIHENCKYKRKITCFKESVSPQKKTIFLTCRNKSVAFHHAKTPPFFFDCCFFYMKWGTWAPWLCMETKKRKMTLKSKKREKEESVTKKTKLSIDGIQAHCPLPLLLILNFDATRFSSSENLLTMCVVRKSVISMI